MKVRELIEKLSRFDSDTEVACYSIEDYYCQADTNFADCGNVVVLSGGYR